jgi:hypothetical protein
MNHIFTIQENSEGELLTAALLPLTTLRSRSRRAGMEKPVSLVPCPTKSCILKIDTAREFTEKVRVIPVPPSLPRICSLSKKYPRPRRDPLLAIESDPLSNKLGAIDGN